ncbi:MAG: electron transport complex subunit E [Anaerolineaceae bacterium]|jgi:electron transport complex protein RnfE
MLNSSYWKEFSKGLWEINPVFKQVLGMCPTLAVTVSALNGLAMGLATTFVLFFSSIMISLVRRLIPKQVRLASYIVIIATFVTIVDLVMKAQFPALSAALGPFIPLIVVNCVILGRAESFASKNMPVWAGLDALGAGLGFAASLTALGSVREILGSRTLLGAQILPEMFEPWVIMILPAGAFLTLGLMMGLANTLSMRKQQKATQVYQDLYRQNPIDLSREAGD